MHARVSTRIARAALCPVVCAAFSFACGGNPQQTEPNSADSQSDPAPLPPTPERTAAEAQDLRLMAAELIAAKACQRLEDRFRPVGGAKSGGPGKGSKEAGGSGQKAKTTGASGEQPNKAAPSDGTLWIERCEASNDGTTVTLDVDAKGWKWIYRKKEKLGGNFEVSQYVPFKVDLKFDAKIDMTYEPTTHLFMAWLTPIAEPKVNFAPLGDVEVDEEGLWSETLGALATLFMSDPDQKADVKLATQGKKKFRQKFKQGFTFAYDLCSGTTHGKVGMVRDQTISQSQHDGEPDMRGEVHAGGLLISGPLEGEKGQDVALRVSADRNAVELQLMCEKDAVRLADAYTHNPDKLPAVPTLAAAIVRETTTLRASASCPLVAVARPVGDAVGTFHYTQEEPPVPGGPLACDPDKQRDNQDKGDGKTASQP